MIRAVIFDLDGTLFDEAVYVGDHPAVDIAGARGAGLKAIWKRDVFWESPTETDGVIDNLNELVAALEKLA